MWNQDLFKVKKTGNKCGWEAVAFKMQQKGGILGKGTGQRSKKKKAGKDWRVHSESQSGTVVKESD